MRSDWWHPVMSTSSTSWLTWRVLLCAIWILMCTVLSLMLIWKYEDFCKPKPGAATAQQEATGSNLHEDDTWRPCLKGVHPAWLLAFRILAFLVLLSMLVISIVIDGGSIFYYYTEWTFTLITFYFGVILMPLMSFPTQVLILYSNRMITNDMLFTISPLVCLLTNLYKFHLQLGTLLSISGCRQHQKTINGNKIDNVEVDAEQGQDIVAATIQADIKERKNSLHPQACSVHKPAGILGYVFQIIFQVNAGGVLLTDGVFWFIIVPFLTVKDYKLNALTVNMHTINAVFLFGDAALNSLHFPCFRVAYVFLWTVLYVVFQWIVHACVNLWWPYPFLDMSSSYAPLWYFTVALLHIPCYGLFSLVIRLKHYLLSTWFPGSYMCTTR